MTHPTNPIREARLELLTALLTRSTAWSGPHWEHVDTVLSPWIASVVAGDVDSTSDTISAAIDEAWGGNFTDTAADYDARYGPAAMYVFGELGIAATLASTIASIRHGFYDDAREAEQAVSAATEYVRAMINIQAERCAALHATGGVR